MSHRFRNKLDLVSYPHYTPAEEKKREKAIEKELQNIKDKYDMHRRRAK